MVRCPRERRHQRLGIPRRIVTTLVDEEAGRSVDATAYAAGEVLTHSRQEPVVLERRLELAHVEPEVASIADEIAGREVRLVLEQPAVHLPELALGPGGLG